MRPHPVSLKNSRKNFPNHKTAVQDGSRSTSSPGVTRLIADHESSRFTGASGVGYLVHQLTVAAALPLIPGLCITLASAILVLGVAIWFVLKLNNLNNPTKRSNKKSL